MGKIEDSIYISKENCDSTNATYLDQPSNFTILERKFITPTVFLLILKDNNHPPFTGVELGGHLRFYIPPAPRTVKDQWNGLKDIESKDLIKRVYTPIFVDLYSKHLHFAIRVYEPCDDFCDGGKGSRTIAKLDIGSEVSCHIVPGKLSYKFPGQFVFQKNTFNVKKVAFIAGGTGITLFYRFISNIFHNPQDNTEIVLLFSVRNIEEIILFPALEQFNLPKIHKHYFVTNFSSDFNKKNITSGYITKEILNSLIKSCCHTFICGPKPFNKYISNILLELGIKEESFTSI